MKTFTTVELLRSLPEVELAASRGPVAITKHRKSRYVLMSVQEFERLTASSKDPRRVYRTEDAPDDVREFLIAGLEEIISGPEDLGG